MIRVAAALAGALLLSGCVPAELPPAPVPPVFSPPPPLPAPAATHESPTVPITSTDLPAVRVSLPPVRVEVPSVEVDVEVVPVGVRGDGEMELPDYVGTAGWYRFGPDPSSIEGTTVIAAHVDSLRWGLGPFARLRDAQPGAEILVTTQDGVEHRYTVESLGRIPKEQLPVDDVFARSGPPRLVLVTCGGTFDREALRYSDNVLVTAVPVR